MHSVVMRFVLTPPSWSRQIIEHEKAQKALQAQQEESK